MTLEAFDLLLIFVGLVFPFLLVLILVWYDMKGAKNAFFIYFHSDKVAELISERVKDGLMELRKKVYIVDKAMPPVIRAGIFVKSFRPLYILKHNRAIPFSFGDEGKAYADRSPENVKNMFDNKTLDQLLTPKTSGGLSIIVFAIGLTIGLLVMYALVASGVIHFNAAAAAK